MLSVIEVFANISVGLKLLQRKATLNRIRFDLIFSSHIRHSESQAVEIIQRDYYFAKKIVKEIVREVEALIEDSVMKDELAAAATQPR